MNGQYEGMAISSGFFSRIDNNACYQSVFDLRDLTQMSLRMHSIVCIRFEEHDEKVNRQHSECDRDNDD